MNKLTTIILTIFFVFSIKNTYASQSLEEILNLDIWPINYELNLETLNEYTFKSKSLDSKYQALKKIDSSLRKLIIQKYAKNEFSENKTNSLVKNYGNFIYYTNEFFYFLKQIDNNPSLKNNIEIQDWVLKSYKNMKNYYKIIFNTIKNPNI